MDTNWALYLLPLAAGLLNAVQSGTNGALNRAIEAPAVVALIALSLAFATMAGVGLLFGKMAVPEAERAASAPWWAWVGGAPHGNPGHVIGLRLHRARSFRPCRLPGTRGVLGRIAGAALMIAGVWLVATL